MTITKEQIEEALEWFNDFMEDTCCGNCQPFSKCMVDQDEVKTIQFALRLAHKVMSEPTQDMVNAALDRDTFGNMYKDIFKAMINAAIEEVGNKNINSK